jgi:oligopeptide transport system ATP-binding protein
MPETEIINNKNVLLSVDDLCMYFDTGNIRVRACEHVSFQIYEGETFGLVGESGSGKSTIGKCIIGLNKATHGSIRFDGAELTNIKSQAEYIDKARGIKMIFQDPMSSLNPRKQVGEIIKEALVLQKTRKSKSDQNKAVSDILNKVGIPTEYATRYPKSFSGGQRQRIGIARALVADPRLIIADECIAALDTSVQAQIVNLLHKIKKETGLSFLFISHDLSMVRFLSDRIGVLHLGYLLEVGTSDEIFDAPMHPYTRGLLDAIPRMNPVIQSSGENKYDRKAFGIDYGLGTWHKISATHKVWCTDQEYELWR